MFLTLIFIFLKIFIRSRTVQLHLLKIGKITLVVYRPVLAVHSLQGIGGS